MTRKQLLDYALTKQGAYVDFPFGDDTLCVKVANHYFLNVFMLKGIEKITTKCLANIGILLREKYPEYITRGYHCPASQQPYNNTITFPNTIPDEEMLQILDHSYDYTIKKLTKKEKIIFNINI